MTDEPKQPAKLDLTATLSLTYGVTLNIAAKALAEIHRLSGPERLNELHQAAVRSAKDGSIEGLSIEEDARAMQVMVDAVDAVFAVARDFASKPVDED